MRSTRGYTIIMNKMIDKHKQIDAAAENQWIFVALSMAPFDLN